MALHGWVGAEDEILNAYASSCLKASEDDEFFAKFKKDEGYRPISVSYTHLTLPTNREV